MADNEDAASATLVAEGGDEVQVMLDSAKRVV